MQFEFATAHRVIFGEGSVAEVPRAARSFGQRAILVTGATGERAPGLRKAIEDAGLCCEPFCVTAEPTVDLIRRAPRHAEMVIAIGGGSVIDAGKAIAALLTNPGDPMDYLEVVGRGQPLTKPAAPCIAIPTTAGTGSEVTRNSVLGSPKHRVKASMRSASMLPKLAVVDPELTLGLPPAITASTGLDALTQLIEPYVGAKANPMTDALCADGIRRVALALLRVWDDPDDREARRHMALASLFGGMALANAGLGAVHGLAGPIGGMFNAPHGAVCAALLPHVMAMNLRRVRDVSRFEEVARLLTGDPNARSDDGVDRVVSLCARFRIPPLRAYGIGKWDIEELAVKASQASSMKGNPVVLSQQDLQEIIFRAL